jgi:hypothetical protein
MSDNRALFVEEAITGAVKRLLTGRVNEILGEADFPIPSVEFSGYSGSSTISPAIVLSTCERTEKERIIRLDAYTLIITFTMPEMLGNEVCGYAYATAVATALAENPTLGGIAGRAVLTGKKHVPPKHC